MKRVVITGLGIISSIGNTKKKVLNSLKKFCSGIIFSNKMKKFHLKSNVCAPVELLDSEKKYFYKNKFSKYMNNSGLYAYLAMKNAIKDAKLDNFSYKRNSKIGLIIGSGCGYLNSNNFFLNKKIKENFFLKNYRKYIKDPFFIFKNMPSSISASLSSIFQLYGVSYSISAACATSFHCIGNSYELIKSGHQDIIFSGGSEELTLELSYYFDILGVLSKKFNNFPKYASRPYDLSRDGFVISEGSGILVLEEMNHAILRNARIYAEIIGYGKSSDGQSMFFPSKKGIVRCMSDAVNKYINCINYINSHGTSTIIGDLIELKAIKKVFKKNYKNIFISSTKSLSGHSLGASGVHSLIHILLMFKNKFIFPNLNIKKLDSFSMKMNLLTKIKKIRINYAMSNNLGFGGNNSTLILKNLMK